MADDHCGASTQSRPEGHYPNLSGYLGDVIVAARPVDTSRAGTLISTYTEMARGENVERLIRRMTAGLSGSEFGTRGPIAAS